MSLRKISADTNRLTCVPIHIPAKIGSVAKVEIAASLHPSRPLPPSVNVIIVAATVRNIDEYCTNRSRLMPRASKYMKTKGPGSAASPPASPPTRPATGPAIGSTFVGTDKRGENSISTAIAIKMMPTTGFRTAGLADASRLTPTKTPMISPTKIGVSPSEKDWYRIALNRLRDVSDDQRDRQQCDGHSQVDDNVKQGHGDNRHADPDEAFRRAGGN